MLLWHLLRNAKANSNSRTFSARNDIRDYRDDIKEIIEIRERERENGVGRQLSLLRSWTRDIFYDIDSGLFNAVFRGLTSKLQE